MLDLLYTFLATSRRRYYERRPHLRRRLSAPVISIGNLTVGGSGKTPLTAEIARMLVDLGERPAILSRGYARANPVEGVVVVSDGGSVTARLAEAGDEPLMLGRLVPGAAVLVCADRYLAGRVAESRLACTVHVLDDGFQHLQLDRDIDLLAAPPEDFVNPKMLPFGRLREPVDAARCADALLVPGSTDDLADISARLHVAPAFAWSRRVDAPSAKRRVFAFAGIAKPDAFFNELGLAGWDVTGQRSFRDHHQYAPRDIAELAQAARGAGAEALVTTSKDTVRLSSDHQNATGGLPIIEVPLHVSIDPAFRSWLRDRLTHARAA